MVIKDSYNSERRDPVKGTSTRMISLGFHLAQSLTSPLLQVDHLTCYSL